MGTVALTFRIMPESPETDLNKVKAEIKNVVSKHGGMELKSVEEKPIAFGLRSLQLLITMPDSQGTGKLEEEIADIDGVASVEAGDVTLL